ncbi:MAG TPA: hypothetical protein VMR99_00420 [Candidatus Paceibacterota bacterium]|nr:hypothetical protein [Candidatus Paceibacterota bacterium]
MKTPYVVLLAGATSLAGFYLGVTSTPDHLPQPQPVTFVLDEQKDYVVTSVIKEADVEHVAIEDSCGMLHYELNFKAASVITRESSKSVDLKKGDKLSIRDSYLHDNEKNKMVSWIAVMSPRGFGTAMPNPKT